MSSPYVTGREVLPPGGFAAAGHMYLAVGTTGATPVLLGVLSALVAIALAVTGWKLARHYRRRDLERADLTELAQLLHRIHVQVQILTQQEGVVTAPDLLTLRTLKVELECVTTPSLPDLSTALANITSRLDAYVGTAVPTGAAGPDTLKQAQRQGRATQDLLTAIRQVQAAVQRLRSR